MTDVYYKLTIFAGLDQDIWLGDNRGNFVAKHTGVFEERLKPGRYVVHFGLKGPKYGIRLDRDLTLTESCFKDSEPEEPKIMLSNRALGIIVLILIAIAVVMSFTKPAQAQETSPHAFLPSCALAQTNDELVSCIKLRLPESVGHTLEKVVTVLGKPLGKGVAVACPKDAVGEPIKEECRVFPSLVHKIAKALVVSVFVEDEGETVLVHLSASELSPEQEKAIEELGAPPGFTPI